LKALAATLALASLWLVGCREAPPAGAVVAVSKPAVAPSSASIAAPEPSASVAPRRQPYLLVQDLPALKAGDGPVRATLHAAEAPGDTGVLQVQAIELQRGGQLLQRIEGLDTQTPASPAPIEVLDMNFDGIADLRLVESRPAGPNTPYLHWLWDNTHQRFVPSPALDDLSAPRFDARRKQVQSDWRDGPTHYGTDTYVWRAGELHAVSRQERLYNVPGRYTLKTYTWADGGWRLQRSQAGRDE
jgi:hypothetical protein